MQVPRVLRVQAISFSRFFFYRPLLLRKHPVVFRRTFNTVCYSSGGTKKINSLHPIKAHQQFPYRDLRCAVVAMAEGGEDRGREGEGEGEEQEPQWSEYLNAKDAREFDNSLLFEYEFSIDQLMEIAGLCVAQAVFRCFPPSVAGGSKVLICCGPGNNGGDGLAAARHLQQFGYEPIIFYPKRTTKEIYQILLAQCERLNITFLTSLPAASEIDMQYKVVIDALFGFSFKGTPRPPFDTVLATLCEVKAPIAAVDIPSGWDVEKGPMSAKHIKPDLLVSLTAPKQCAQHFHGSHHYLGLRLIPPELITKFHIRLPPYPDADQIVRLK